MDISAAVQGAFLMARIAAKNTVNSALVMRLSPVLAQGHVTAISRMRKMMDVRIGLFAMESQVNVNAQDAFIDADVCAHFFSQV